MDRKPLEYGTVIGFTDRNKFDYSSVCVCVCVHTCVRDVVCVH